MFGSPPACFALTNAASPDLEVRAIPPIGPIGPDSTFAAFPWTRPCAAHPAVERVHHPHLETKLLDQVLIKFYWLREQNELRKRPSTSELIDWISALLRSGISPKQLEDHLPFVGALLKKEQDAASKERLHAFEQPRPRPQHANTGRAKHLVRRKRDEVRA